MSAAREFSTVSTRGSAEGSDDDIAVTVPLYFYPTYITVQSTFSPLLISLTFIGRYELRRGWGGRVVIGESDKCVVAIPLAFAPGRGCGRFCSDSHCDCGSRFRAACADSRAWLVRPDPTRRTRVGSGRARDTVPRGPPKWPLDRSSETSNPYPTCSYLFRRGRA